MSVHLLHTESDVAAVRRTILEGLATVPVFAKAIGRSNRTVFTYINEGLPVVHFGRTPFIDVAAGREWLLSRRKAHQNRPRRRLLPTSEATSLPPTAA